MAVGGGGGAGRAMAAGERLVDIVDTADDVPAMHMHGSYMHMHMHMQVGVSWMSLLAPDAGNLSALRSVRVLRPLRTVTRIKSMRVLVGALLRSLPDVADVVLLFGFFLLAFGVVGVELFMGRLHYRCFDEAAGIEADSGAICTCGSQLDITNGTGGCDDKCAVGEVCRYMEANPNRGAAGFDHILFAATNIFQSITLEGWTDLMYMLQARRASATWRAGRQGGQGGLGGGGQVGRWQLVGLDGVLGEGRSEVCRTEVVREGRRRGEERGEERRRGGEEGGRGEGGGAGGEVGLGCRKCAPVSRQTTTATHRFPRHVSI